MNPRRILWVVVLLLGATASAQATEVVVYYHTDALHSATTLTNAQGQVIERTHYAPYGQVLNRALRDGPGYAGHEEDAATGLVYMQQRYYDPESGTFLSADPVQANTGAGFNRYAYANDNPYRYTDPDGRCPTGSKDTVCIEAKHSDSINKSLNVTLSKSVEKFASTLSVRSTMAGAENETLKAITSDSKGDLKLTPMPNTKTSSDASGGQASGNLPAHTEAVIHAHTYGMSMTDKPSGLADAQPLEAGKPNITVSPDGNREGVHEIENGVVQFRMIRGSMTDEEIKDIQTNLDRQQQIINPGGGQ